MEKLLNSVTVIIPAFNEQEGLSAILPPLIKKCKELGWNILVVNDASTDNTADIAKGFEPDIRLINHKENLGYGAAVKTGIQAANSEWIATFDADGQHRIEDLMRLAADAEGYDAIIGSRGENSHDNLLRKIGKFFFSHICNMIIGKKIGDINCGLRIIRRKTILKVLSFTCNRFSFSTSSLIALMNMNYRIKFIKIFVTKRIGKSTVRQFRDGFETILLTMRLARRNII